MELQVQDWGFLSYEAAYERQKLMLQKRQEHRIPDTLVLVEHPPVITCGRRTPETDILLSPEELEKLGVSIFQVERGGEATYHGPGQIVGYLFADIEHWSGNVKKLVSQIEEVFIELLKSFHNITAGQDPSHRGVWVGNEKITAVGLAVKKHITMHGFAFNVNTDIENFSWIIPCGITNKGVASLKRLTGHVHDMMKIKNEIVQVFSSITGYDRVEVIPAEIFS